MILNETVYGKPIIEDISKENLPDGVLCRVSYPICDIGKRNANGRVYEDAVWEKVHEDSDLKNRIADRKLFGHAEHPEQTQSNLEKISHVITEMWRDGDQEWQKFDVFNTPTGRIVDCLLKSCPVGCSTRAEGDLEEAEDEEGTFQRVVPESYRYVTTDFTADPSTAGSIPHDIKRNIVSEVKKMFENKEANESEQEFAEKVLESMQCKKSKDHECKDCGCCKTLDERKLSAKEVKKTVASLLKEGILKEGAKVKYEGKDAKVEKIEEGTVSLSVGDGELTDVVVNGNASVGISPEGLITIMPAGVSTDTEPEIPIDALPEKPIDDTPVEDEPIVEPGNTGLGMPAVDVDDEVPESKEYKVGDTVKIEEKQKLGVVLTGSDIGQKEREPKYFDTEEEAKEYADRMNKQLTKGEKQYYKLKYKVVEGKVTKIEEAGITIALDDGTTVNIEDPTAVNITVTPPAPEEEIEPVEPPEEEIEDMEAAGPLPIEDEISDELGEARVATKGGVSDKLADGNLLQDKNNTYWTVTEITDTNLLVTQPGEAGTEKSIGWDEVPSYGFTKISEKVEECVCHIYGMDDNKLLEFYSNVILNPEHYTSEVAQKQLVVDKLEVETEITKRNLEIPIIAERELEKSKKAIVVREKDDGWGVFITGDGKDRFLTRFDEQADAIKQAEKYAGEKGVDYGGVKESKIDESIKVGDTVEVMDLEGNTTVVPASKVTSVDTAVGADGDSYTVVQTEKGGKENYSEEHQQLVKVSIADESISTTVKEIKNLKIQEASTRAERDKAVELLEELTDEKQQFEAKVTKDKTLEIKMLVKKMGKTLETKEQEVDALRSKLEEKAKFAAEQKKLVSETRANSLKGITDLTESVSKETKVLKNTLQESKDRYAEELEQLHEALTNKKLKHKEDCEVLEEKIKGETTAEITEKFIKSFVEFRLSESNLKVDENSRALLEKSKSLEDVDNLLDEIIDASRRSALHSEAIRGIRVSKHMIPDLEGDRIRRSVSSVYEGMNG